MISVSDLGAKIVSLLSQDESSTDYWVRVFRNLQSAGLLIAADYRGHGRTARAEGQCDGDGASVRAEGFDAVPGAVLPAPVAERLVHLEVLLHPAVADTAAAGPGRSSIRPRRGG